ncbi:ribosome production factor 2 homolog [Phlebotomus papatasi]|uniref:ribosome production factor 2 homolog n=1 Tax=Phlebotomus papatasi TaxID=29031 RepID=UPI0024838A33|nr:ribosome production factor 2 homolog [Phlebotomus papatasi]
MSLLRIKKPTTRKGKQVLLNREPKLIENVKNTLILEGRKCSGEIKSALKDLYHLKKPQAKCLSRQNEITPFDDEIPLLQLAQKNECSLFMFGSTSKKRPNNLILGRLYEQELLDMVELGLVKYRGLQEFKNEKISSNVKPCLVFNGPKWTQSEELRRLKCLLIDAFHREAVDNIRLQGMEHVLSFTLTDDLTVLMRSYRILLKKSGQRTPRIELTEIGPACDFVIRRTKIASEDLYKLSRKRPKQLKPLKKKNLSTDVFGNKQGQVHVGKQNIHKIQTRKVKALKKTAEERKAEKNRAETAVNGEGE